MEDIDWDVVPRTGGAYCIYDLVENPVYVGNASESDSRTLVHRLREHFTQQNSSVVTHERLDLLDVWYVDIWKSDDWDAAEGQLIAEFDPVFNRENPSPEAHPIEPTTPDERLTICDSATRERRLEPESRIRTKMDHIQRMVDSDQVALRALVNGKQKRVSTGRDAAEYHLSLLEKAIDDYYGQWE